MEYVGFSQVKQIHSKMKQGERFKRIQFINTPPIITPDAKEENN